MDDETRVDSVGTLRVARVAMLCVSLALVVTSSARTGRTFDEQMHVEAGLEWLRTGRYTISPETPPLARIAMAVGPALAGISPADANDGWLRWARAGTLPFFVLAAGLISLWARRAWGDADALAALAVFGTVPAVLAHAGLATTDMAFTAMALLALFAARAFLRRPDLGRALGLGAAIGLAFLTKFSSLMLGPCLVVLAIAFRRQVPSWRRVARGAVLAAAAFALVAAAGYRFDVSSLASAQPDRQRIARAAALCPATADGLDADATRPLPALVFGAIELCAHGANGHRSYLRGEVRDRGGFRSYYLWALAVKLPMPLWVFAIAGLAAGIAGGRTRNETVALCACAAAFVVVASMSSINIGVRHVLPVFGLLALVAGRGLAALWRWSAGRTPARAVVLALIAAQLLVPLVDWPDYLAHRSLVFARADPPPLLDSDLDWGQGLPALRRTLAQRGIDDFWFAYFGGDALGFPPGVRMHPLPPGERPRGWVAISAMLLYGVAGDGGYTWLREQRPAAVLAGSIFLYDLRR